jgi:DNA-binding NtrC family response regulator
MARTTADSPKPGAHHDPPPRLRVQDFFTRSPAMRRCLQMADFAARSDVPVLVLGETGTGKTLMAQAIHLSSRRAAGAFISFNTSAMSDTLLESQLFGHERGAFTGASKSIRGKFELADGGTLFLDEIADMSLLAQAKILRAVEYGEFERLGTETLRHSNARIITATNASLRDRVRARQFREDLYHRLRGLTLTIPPLRERPEDLPVLVASELKQSARQMGRKVTQIEPAAMDYLMRRPWPGNLRELHHTLRTVLLFVDGPSLGLDHLRQLEQVEPDWFAGESQPQARESPASTRLNGHETLPHDDPSLDAALLRHVRSVYEACGRRQREAAARLGIGRSTLIRYLKRDAGSGAAAGR